MGGHDFRPGFRRIEEALRGEVARVPFVAQMHEFAMKRDGTSSDRFYADPDRLVRGILSVAEDFGFDAPTLGYDVYNIEVEALGARVRFPEGGPPEIDGPPLVQAPADLARLRPPEFGAAGRMPFVLEANRRFEDATGEAPTLQFTGPFTLAATLRGYENLIQDIYGAPAFAHEILRFATEEVLVPWIRTLREASPRASVVRGADAMASLPLVDLPILREFAVPYVLRLREACGPEVSILNWWGESYLKRPEELLEEKRRVSPAVVQGQDPDVEKVGPEVYKAFARREGVALILGVGNAFLNRADPGEIRARVRRYLSVGAPGGRFVLYFCNLGSTTPEASVRAAVAAVREFGEGTDGPPTARPGESIVTSRNPLEAAPPSPVGGTGDPGTSPEGGQS